MSSCNTPSLSICALCHNKYTLNCNLSFSTFRCSRAASALRFSILIVDFCSSNSSFLSHITNCMNLYWLLLNICSLFDCDSSVKSDDRLLGNVHNFFFRVGKSTMFHLGLWVSTSICLLSSTSSVLLSLPSTISKGLIDNMVASGVLLALSCITSASTY